MRCHEVRQCECMLMPARSRVYTRGTYRERTADDVRDASLARWPPCAAIRLRHCHGSHHAWAALACHSTGVERVRPVSAQATQPSSGTHTVGFNMVEALACGRKGARRKLESHSRTLQVLAAAVRANADAHWHNSIRPEPTGLVAQILHIAAQERGPKRRCAVQLAIKVRLALCIAPRR